MGYASAGVDAAKGRWLGLRASWVRPLAYGALNIASASGIVFANKLVMTTYGFSFTCTLTWIHTLFTLVGMRLFLMAGMFQHKSLQSRQLLPLAAAYVGYIVLCNLSLKVNTVGFYQVMKIAVAPTVMLLDLIFFGIVPAPKVVASVVLVCLGIGIATVTDSTLVKNLYGLFVGVAATLLTALYQLWAGSKQKELQASSMQLLHQYTPQAALILGLLIPLMEPVGWASLTGSAAAAGSSKTILSYNYTPAAVGAIVVSAVLGLVVSLSTFLVIGCTSSLTYNVVGHLKTVIILAGGCLFFGDEMPPKKLLGVGVAMAGILWYTQLKISGTPAKSAVKAAEQLQLYVPDNNTAAAAAASMAPNTTAAWVLTKQ
ncbi:triose-phosphate transporter family-domain-containing protein [Scenedesmus sp. NREL 46B-D3]|nr:triose-phosphate transporter family-domain-containing protein [Scenedesmus sp. NREL 46B-D3]